MSKRQWSKALPTSANDKPGIALIGCGGMGTWDGQNAGNQVEPVVCKALGHRRLDALQFAADPAVGG